jgi:RHS repeat-associated protein
VSVKSGVAEQALSLPKGGGAIAGIGEKFGPDLQTGTGNLSVPIGLPSGRNGFDPKLQLLYSSGSGNGPFGLGWSLSVPGVTRKTSNGIPRYDDEHDIFVLSGSEDLVLVERTATSMRFRPRCESSFAWIDHVLAAGTDHWEVRTRDGLVSTYGTPGRVGNDPAAIANPARPPDVFAWKISTTVDTFGNRIEYEYEHDPIPEEGSQRYLSRIRYIDFGDPAKPQYLVEIRFVYEERPDAFSDCRAGFVVRTRRRCTRIETRCGGLLNRIHHLTYARPEPANGASLLASIRIEGVDDASTESLTPIDFSYTAFEPRRRRFIPIQGPELPPVSLAHSDFEQADVFARGLPDVIQMDGDRARYWRNLGGGRLDRPREMREAPAGFALGDPAVQLLDANGDGRIDLMVNTDKTSGYFALRSTGLWDRRAFRAYAKAPTVSFSDPEVKLVDIDGDGVIDAVRSGAAFEYFFNDPQRGWEKVREVQRRSLDVFPDVSFSDPRVRWADMTGDGLQDVVLIHDRIVEYWPSLGRGDWAPRVRMANCPRLPYRFDPRRVLLGDIDGDGLADLIYVEDNKITFWLNRSGNGWSDPIEIVGTPPVSDLDAVRLTDFLGCGTAGVLWTSEVDGTGRRPRWFFLDLTGGTKPYLLNQVSNGRGAITRIEYAPSTRFYLEDEASPATRWKTTLPFPVQVVARVESIDALSGGKLTTEYRYHHGQWDGAEREFRGFARVEQFDTERFDEYHASGRSHAPVPRASFSPPTETRLWFHVGPIGDEFGEWSELDCSGEFFGEDPTVLARPKDTTHLLNSLPRPARRDAIRCLSGRLLRTELYARDGSELRDRPYTVAEHQFGLREESPPTDPHRRRVFFPHLVSERTTQWERGTDPLNHLRFLDGYDAFGQAGSEIDIGVPRGRDYRTPASSPTEPYLARQTVTERAKPVNPSTFLVDRVSRSISYEFPLDGGNQTAFDFQQAIVAGSVARKPFAYSVTFYDGDAFIGLPFGSVGDHGSRTRVESLVLTDEHARVAGAPPYLNQGGAATWTSEYPAPVQSSIPDGAGYFYHPDDRVFAAGYYAVTSSAFDFQLPLPATRRGLLRVARDALGRDSRLDDHMFDLLPTRTVDPLGLETRADFDVRTLRPSLVTDPNGNRTLSAFTPLGLLVSTVRLGKPTETIGDTPAQPGLRYVYDHDAFVARGQPVSVRTVARVYHAHDASVRAAEHDDTVEKIEYSDGFGRLIQTRTLGEDVRFGDARFGDAGLAPDPAQAIGPTSSITRAPAGSPFVAVTGWQIYDNKGNVVEKYEPFFSTGWAFEPQVASGVKISNYYDPRGELVLTVNPDGSEQRAIFGTPIDLTNPDQIIPSAWERTVYDPNDNAGRTHPAGSSAYRAHWNTPTSILVDAWGRTVRTTIRNGAEVIVTAQEFDVRGNLRAVVDSLARPTFTWLHDLANQVIRSVGIDGGTMISVFDAAGQPIERRDEKGSLVLRTFDAGGRPVELWARDVAGEAVGLRERIDYGDKLPDGKDRNAIGRPIEKRDEAGSITIDRYDFKGNVLASTRQVLADDLFTAAPLVADVRPYRVDWSLPAAPVLEPRDYRIDYVYDALDRNTALFLPKDVTGRRRHMARTFNRAGLLESVTVDGVAHVAHIAYNARGQRIMTVLGSGILTRYAHDPVMFRVLRQRSERFTEVATNTYQPTGAPLFDVTYRYDLAGNVVRMTDLVPGSGVPSAPNRLERLFDYDPVYRLVRATGRECVATADPGSPWVDAPRCQDPTLTQAYSETYGYDAVGNLTTLRHQAGGSGFTRTLTPRGDSNRLDTLLVGGATHQYHHDPSGNVIAEDTSRAFEWDHSNRMRAFREGPAEAAPTVFAQYLYDSSGHRVKKIVRKAGAVVSTTVYVDTVFETHRNTRPSGAEENDAIHVAEADRRVAIIRVGPPLSDDPFATLVDGVMVHLADHLNSSTVVTDGSGAFLSREEYTPFGETSFGGFAKKRHRFTGKERDEESGLMCFGIRYLAPWLARWTSPDPSGAVDGLNLYQYVGGNPMALIDPTGTQSEVAPSPGPAPSPSPPATTCTSTSGSSWDPGPGPSPGPAPETEPPYVAPYTYKEERELLQALASNRGSWRPEPKAVTTPNPNASTRNPADCLLETAKDAAEGAFGFGAMGANAAARAGWTACEQEGWAGMSANIGNMAAMGADKAIADTKAYNEAAYQTRMNNKAVGSEEGAAEVRGRTEELHGLRGDVQKQKRTTTEGVRGIDPVTGEVRTFIATEGGTVGKKGAGGKQPKQFEGQLKAGEEFIAGHGHGTQKIIDKRGQYFDLYEGGTTRNHCIDICEPRITGQGHVLGGPEFKGAPNKTKYRQHWRP